MRWGSPLSFLSVSPSPIKCPVGSPQAEAGGGAEGSRVVKKIRVLSIAAKRGSARPHPFPAFNLITAPHSPNRSGLQPELFTGAAFVILSIPQSLEVGPGAPCPQPQAGRDGPNVPLR